MPGPRSVRSAQHANGPPSPTLSATTRASLDFPSRPGLLITRADLRNSLNAYEKLLTSAKAYTNAMLAMAKASSDLACALEECARVKGAHESGPSLQAAGGLHFLKSNYEQVLCDTFWKDFSIPLLSHYDTYRAACNDRQMAHDKAINEKSKQLKEAEARNMRTGRRRERDLNQFRRALQELQAHVDELDEIKAQYYHEVLESEEEVWEFITSKVALVVRSQIEISERISSKGLSDPILEPMLSAIPDPFGSYGPPKQEDQIFSILPPTSLLSSASNSIHGGAAEGAAASGAANGQPAGANGVATLASISPASLMSPTTPSKGLTRNPNPASSAASPSAAAKTPEAAQTPVRTDPSQAASSSAAADEEAAQINGHAPQLSSVSDAAASVATSESSATTGGGLFGSESLDFEELLDRDREKKQRSAFVTRSTPTAPTLRAESSGDATATTSTLRNGLTSDMSMASRAKHVLSVIDEDAGAPSASFASIQTATSDLDRVAENAEEVKKGTEKQDGDAQAIKAQATRSEAPHASMAVAEDGQLPVKPVTEMSAPLDAASKTSGPGEETAQMDRDVREDDAPEVRAVEAQAEVPALVNEELERNAINKALNEAEEGHGFQAEDHELEEEEQTRGEETEAQEQHEVQEVDEEDEKEVEEVDEVDEKDNVEDKKIGEDDDDDERAEESQTEESQSEAKAHPDAPEEQTNGER
ncbi:hypothetical protein ACQY0O_003324 [Thecaphora frezii]